MSSWQARTAVAAACLWAATSAMATVSTFEGPISTPGSLWSDPTNWSGGTAYPATKDDVGYVDNLSEQVTYDAASSGVLGGLSLWLDVDSRLITLDRDLLLDYTGDTGDTSATMTPAGWFAYQTGDSYTTRTRLVLNTANTLSLTGLRQRSVGTYSGWGGIEGAGTLRFLPDGDDKAYVYSGGNGKAIRAGSYTIDFSAPSVVEVMNYNGVGVTDSGISATNQDNTNSANSKPIIVGCTDGTAQRFAAQASVSGTASGKEIVLVPSGMSGRYGPKLVVNASGTAASPNLVVFEIEAWGGLSFPNNSGNASGGSWIEPSGSGVARLVLEGNLTTDDNSYTDALWNMSQIELQMAGEQAASQSLLWCADDHNASGTGDLFDFSGFTNNYAVRKLVIGSDEGTAANHVDFNTTTAGAALYVWGLEFTEGGYLNFVNADDYIYYLGGNENVGGIQGMGLSLPAGTTLADFTNRPDNIIMLGTPEPATAGLLGLGLIPLLRRRRRQ